MGGLTAGLVAITLASTACSFKRAGKTIAGGVVVMTTGGVVWQATTEDEGSGKPVPTISMMMVPIGLFIVTGGVWAATRNCPPQR